jgi:hypothetical protein
MALVRFTTQSPPPSKWEIPRKRNGTYFELQGRTVLGLQLGNQHSISLLSKCSASHSRVARKMLVYRKNKSTIHLHVIPVMKCGFVFGNSQKGSGQHEKIR